MKLPKVCKVKITTRTIFNPLTCKIVTDVHQVYMTREINSVCLVPKQAPIVEKTQKNNVNHIV